MKKFFLAALALTASTVYAEQIVVMEAKITSSWGSNLDVQTNFYMDQATGQGYVKARVNQIVRTHPREGGPNHVTVFSDKVSVPNLVLMGNDAVYQGAGGNVVCGTMGVSRVFKVPTLYLSGNCVLSSVILRDGRKNKLVVSLTTK